MQKLGFYLFTATASATILACVALAFAAIASPELDYLVRGA